MQSPERRIAWFDQMPNQLLELYARVTARFVYQVRQRRARQWFVPASCTNEWVAELAQDAQLAERVLASRVGDRRLPS